MAKKIYDIRPPKVDEATQETVVPLNIKEKKKKTVKSEPTIKTNKKVSSTKKKSFLQWSLIGGGVIILVLALYFYRTLPKADVQIWPKVSTITLSEKITADTSKSILDITGKIIPAKYVEQEQSITQEFLATGTASDDGKSQGTITVHSKINSPFTLIKGTHFLSDSGKYFVTLKKIIIPAAQKNVPGSVDVGIQAEESGADYNIGPSKFSVPKLYGTSYYYSIYADSSSAMTGGHTGSVKKVTSDDLQKAKDAVAKSVLAQAQDSLKGKLSPDDVLLDGAMITSVVDVSSNVKSDTITDKFNEQGKVKISALVFKKKDLETLLKNDMVSELKNDTSFIEKSLHSSYTVDSVDIKGGKVMLTAQSSIDTYESINSDDLVDLFHMKSSDQIQQIVEQMYNDKISRVKVTFWPFWVKSAPNNRNRINIEVNLE